MWGAELSSTAPAQSCPVCPRWLLKDLSAGSRVFPHLLSSRYGAGPTSPLRASRGDPQLARAIQPSFRAERRGCVPSSEGILPYPRAAATWPGGEPDLWRQSLTGALRAVLQSDGGGGESGLSPSRAVGCQDWAAAPAVPSPAQPGAAACPPFPRSRPARQPSTAPASPTPLPPHPASPCSPQSACAPRPAQRRTAAPAPPALFSPSPLLSNAAPPIGCLRCHSATQPAAVGRRCGGGGTSPTLYKGRRGAALVLLRRARRTDECLLPCSFLAMANPIVFFDISANSEPLGRVTFEVGAGGGWEGAGGAVAISLPGARGRWGPAGAARAARARRGRLGVAAGLRRSRPGGANKGPRSVGGCQPGTRHRPRQAVRTWPGTVGSPLPPASLPPCSRRASAPPRGRGGGAAIPPHCGSRPWLLRRHFIAGPPEHRDEPCRTPGQCCPSLGMLAEGAGNPIATVLSLEGEAFVTPPEAQSIPGMAGPAPGAAAAADSGPRSRTGGASSPKSS